VYVVPDPARLAVLNRSSPGRVVSGVSRAETLTGRLSVAEVALRLLGAAALAISSYVHLHGAHHYTSLGNTITQADLFYAQGAIAAAVALWVLVTGHRLAWVAVALVGAASFAAVMVYRYVNVGAIGPLPNMYSPSWEPSPDKLMSAYAEAAALIVAVIALFSRSVRTPSGRGPAARH